MQELLKNLWNDELGSLDFSYEQNIFNPELAALIMCANEQNYKELLSLKSYVSCIGSNNFFELKMLQIAVLNSIKNNLLNPLEISFYLEKLHTLRVSDSVFEYLKNAKSQNQTELKNSYSNEQLRLENVYKELKTLLSSHLQKRIDELYEQLQNKTFKIAFSGIFNAGKSSLINALLGREFLGVSNAPETANLSIISYGNESIKVNFYSDVEFSALKKQASLNAELSEIFNVDFVPHESVNDDISRLYEYTSANSKNSIFVKDINIYLDNEYLKNKIEIIDTPGLDDVVISREQQSKEFLKQANCVLYLMTCTQALSIKDLEFLLGFSKNNPNSKLILVLTKSDLISQDEQIKLKEYVKNRFNNELKKLDITPNYELFCVSASEFAKDAAKGEISALKAYLNDVCFNSTNTMDFIASICEKFKNLIDLELISLEEQNNLFKLDKSEFDKQISAMQAAQQNKKEQIKQLEMILNEYLNITYSFQKHELEFLAKNQAVRLSDEFNYDKNYQESQAKSVIIQGFKDLLSGTFSAMRARFLNEFAELRAKLNIINTIEFELSSEILNEIFAEFERILKDIKIARAESDIKEQLIAIYLNINLNIFSFSKAKTMANEFLNSEFLRLYHIENTNFSEFDTSSYENNLEKIAALKQLKESLK